MSSEPGKPRGQEAVQIVRDFLTEMNLHPEEVKLSGCIGFRVALEGPVEQGVAQIHADIERFAFVFMFPGFVAPERRPKVAEFIVRANWGIIDGSFEINLDTGAYGFRVGLDFTYNGLTAPLVRNMILSGMNTIEAYAAELFDVVAGTMEPRAAVLMAQSRMQEST